jgi:hypothetical protein
MNPAATTSSTSAKSFSSLTRRSQAIPLPPCPAAPVVGKRN